MEAQILTAADDKFAVRQASYWSSSAKIQSAYIVLPISTEEVATTIKAVVDAGRKFSVRSGGHTN